MGRSCLDFVDFLERSGQKIWQILPITQVDDYLSPYSSPDGFAGNQLLINLDSLAESEILDNVDWSLLNNKDKSCYRKEKEKALRRIYQEWIKKEGRLDQLENFYQVEKSWLEDHLLYYMKRKKESDRNYLIFLQKIFMDQYLAIKKYANEKGISIFGDLPFYVNLDSREVFAHEKYFSLDQEGKPLWQSGVPGDSFQKLGQLWGTPVYDWEEIEKDDFSFFLDKFKRLALFYDYLRIDHFRGLEAVWQVDWDAEDARGGHWSKVPGDQLLAKLVQLKRPALIAENLGFITQEVEDLLQKYSLAGMKILQFLEGDLYLFKESKNNLYYTGTHDNATLLSWVREKFSPTKDLEKEIAWDFIKKVWRSRALWALAPLQDILLLGDEGRMNLPGTVEGNWQWTWQADYESLKDLEKELLKLTREARREGK